MQGISLRALVAAAALVAGCASFEEWTAGSIEEGIPKLAERLPRTTKVHLDDPVNVNGYMLHARNRRQIEEAFGNAFARLGVYHSSKTNGCDVSVHVGVDRWEYGEAGFAGEGGRDAVSMSVMVRSLKTNRVLTRASLFARNLDLLAELYARTLFKDEK